MPDQPANPPPDLTEGVEVIPFAYLEMAIGNVNDAGDQYFLTIEPDAYVGNDHDPGVRPAYLFHPSGELRRLPALVPATISYVIPRQSEEEKVRFLLGELDKVRDDLRIMAACLKQAEEGLAKERANPNHWAFDRGDELQKEEGT